MKKTIDNAVGSFSDLMQYLQNRVIQAQMDNAYKVLKPQIRQMMPGNGGVLLVLGVAETREITVDDDPQPKEYLGLHIAGAGPDMESVKTRYLHEKSLVNMPRDPSMFYRKDYYFWVTVSDLERR